MRAAERHGRRSLLTVACSSVVVAGLLLSAASARAGANAATNDFFSSFESADPQPAWTDTVETDASGNKKASNVSGTSFAGIPGGIRAKIAQVTASGENASGGEAKENLIDGDVNTKWLTFASTGWVAFRLSEPVAVATYALTSANDFPTRDPRDWQLQGSQDGSSWTTVDTRTNQSFSARFTTNEYRFTNAQAYVWYRLNITLNSGDSAIQLAEFQMSDGSATAPDAPDMRSVVGNGPTSAYTAKTNVGWTGLNAFEYSGRVLSPGRGYSYNKVFDVDVAVTPTTQLSYVILPQLVVPAQSIPSIYTTVLKENRQIQDASNQSVFHADLSSSLGGDNVYLRFDDAFPDDGWGPAVHQVTVTADGAVVAQFVPGTSAEEPFLYDADGSQLSSGLGGHRYADNHNFFVYRFPAAGVQSLSVDIDMWNEYKVSATSIEPSTSAAQQLARPSTYASIDLAFTDGTYLSDLGALDQHGFGLNPQAQGASKSLYVNQWNFISSRIGAVAAGKTIDRILVAYDDPAGTGSFKGWIDDVKIVGSPPQQDRSHLADYVITTRGTNANGTFSRGNNIPATAVPHGFNFWVPETNAGSTSWLYEYQAQNNSSNLPTLQAFALSHEPSPWMGDRQTFQVMPSPASGMPNASRTTRALAFQHANEIARPYLYSVQFENGMRTEIAPTDHAAIFRFTFTGSTGNLIFDNVNSSGGLTLNPLTGVATGYSDVRSGLSTGATRMFVYGVVDKPVTASGPLTGGGGTGVTGYFQFDTSNARVVTMRIATSLISVDQAKHNLELEIGASDTFDTVRDRARAAWDKTLGVVEVQGATEDQLTTLYSNLYRLNLYPNSAFENTATNDAPVYKHAVQSSTSSVNLGTPTQTAATIADGKVYVNNGFWDTYRTTWAAYSLLEPREAGEMIDGFVQQYKDGGWIARWSSPGYADLMVGTSSDVAFADAYVKGVTNFDVKAAYDAALKNAAVAPPNANVGRKGLATSIFNGYTSTSTGEGFSWSMDGYINDFGIASMSKALYEASEADDPRRDEYRENYEYYRNRALNYVNLFDPSTKFFQGRTSSGPFRLSPSSFDPRVWGSDYTETNAWNMAFTVPQDGQGLANLYGGKQKLAAKLDQFFATPETAKFPGSYGGTIHEMTEARDVQLGQYGHSNQPSHHIMYMYDYAGQPAQAQAKVREALSRLYTGSEIGQGYPGDEDNGEMSSWYVFSALGFYPLQMGSPYYAIGSPLFTKATIHLENGKDIVVNATGNSTRNVYVQGLRVNGAPWRKSYLPHDLLANGAVLDFDMGSQPSSWGTGADDAPLSLTKGDDVPQPLVDATGPGKGTATTSTGTDVAGLFDNTSATRVTLLGPPVNLAGVQTPWFQYQFVGPKEKATFYTLTSGADTTSGDPASWVLKGSNDGQNWTVLDQRSGETFSWRLYTRAFKVARPGRYGYYRIEITGNGAQLSTTLAEVELLAVPVDVKPPVTTATLTPAAVNDWYVDPTLTLAADDGTGDGVDSIEYRLDGAQAWATYDSPFPVTGDGTHVLEYRSIDLAGNVEVAKTLTFKVDGSAPVTTASLSPSPVNGWYADPTVTLAATDETSSIDRTEYRLDGATSWTVYERPFEVTGDGEHTLEYRSVDLAGNVEATRSLSFMIDAVPPGTTASVSPDPVNGWYVNPRVTLTATAGGSGVNRTEYRLERAQEWTTYTQPFQVTGDGSHTLEYRSVSTAGVVEAAKTLILKVDGNAPATDARLSPDTVGGWYVNPTVTLSGTDEASDVDRSEYRLDGSQTWTDYGGPFQVSGDGGHTLEFRSVDRAGNVEATKTRTFKVDATKPAITLTKPTDGAIYMLNAAVNAAYSCNDSRSGVDTCRGSVANGAALDTSSVGFHDFTVHASDLAGNTRTLTVTYQVIWAFDGFFSPVKNPPTLNAVKAGSSVPIKFTLGGNYGLAIFAEGYPKSVVISCASGAPQDDIGDTVVAQNGLSYSGGKYTYGWKTSTAWAGTCRQFAVVLIDGTLHRANFKLKK